MSVFVLSNSTVISNVLLIVVSIGCTSWKTYPCTFLSVFLVYAKFPFVQILPTAPIAAIVKSSSHSHPLLVVLSKIKLPVLAKSVAPAFILTIISSLLTDPSITPPILA